VFHVVVPLSAEKDPLESSSSAGQRYGLDSVMHENDERLRFTFERSGRYERFDLRI
jgi:hypothetical protein